MKIVFLDRNTLPSRVRLRAPAFAHDMVSYDQTSPNDVAERIRDADVVIVNKVRVTDDAIRSAPRLKLIAVAATGTDNINLQASQRHGIVVSNIRDYAVHSVPEHTFALIFALRRSICAYRDAVRAGCWQAAGQFCFFDHPIRDLAGATLGIVGGGALGQSVARLGKAFGMRVLIAARKGDAQTAPDRVPFAQLLAEADVITLHCPLLPETHHMIGPAEFAAMRRAPLLVNTARGGLVDERAVGPALAAGQISGAAFDVASVEPPLPDHPLMALAGRPNFILTPHVAWASDEAVQALADQLIDNIDAFAMGTPANVVSPC